MGPLQVSWPLMAVGAAVVIPGLLAGGWPLEALPVLSVLAAAAWTVGTWRRWSADRRVTIPLIGLVLGALACFTALQALPLLGAIPWLSPRAADVHAFLETPAPAVSYEVGATWREAAKLLAYALVAVSAHQVARRRGTRPVLVLLVVAGAASVVVGLAHRVLRLAAMWGVLPLSRPAAELVTTYQNPNHASAMLGLAALVAAGLGVDAARRETRVGFLLVAAVLAGASMVEPSKGGVLSLLVGLGVFGGLLWLRSRGGREGIGIPVLFGALLLPLAGLVWRLDAVLREFGFGDGPPLGLIEKLAAVRNAWPIVLDHPWTGIGRGAYISVYPHYQTSPLQLTFAFPENLLAQLTSEWGLVVGGAAFIALGVGVATRLGRAKRPHELGALAGAFALLVHDLVDFSMEMPGVAVMMAALLGATTPGRPDRSQGAKSWFRLRLKGHRGWGPIQLDLRPGILSSVLVGAPIVLLISFTVLAWRGGDVREDVAWLSGHAQAVASGAPVDEPGVRTRSARHPANVLVATQLAYLREVQRPSALEAALRAANRALFLGPRYADAHVLAGRLLLRAGHRRQALEELRTAWALTQGRGDLLHTAARWARSPADLLRVVPRSDPAADRVDVNQASRMVRILAKRGELERAQGLLGLLPAIDALDPGELASFSHAALVADQPELALAAARRGTELRPEDATLAFTLARLAHRAGRLDEARRLAAEIPPKGVDPVVLLEFRFALALQAKDGEAARALLDALRRTVPLTRESQTDLALREARLHLAEGRPDRAIPVLSRAIDWSPANVTVRMLRASAFARVGRSAEARVDAEAVLRRRPEHAGARRLLSRLGRGP